MANKPTKQQQRAIDAPHDSSVIVTAAAGSGKTTLLVERMVRLLSDRSLGIDGDSAAIMTFTRNAADNLRVKLMKALGDKLKAPETAEEEREYLSEQLIKLRSAPIGTIDSFCINIIRENVQAFGLPVNFSIADSAKKASMQELAMQMTLRYFYDDEGEITPEDRAALFCTFSFEDDTLLQQTILRIAEKLSSYADSERWLESCAAAYDSIESLEARYIAIYGRKIKSVVTELYRAVSQYGAVIAEYDLWCENNLPDKREKIISNLKEISLSERGLFRKAVRYSAKMRKTPSMNAMEELCSHAAEFNVKQLTALNRLDASNPIKDKFKRCREKTKDALKKLNELRFVKSEEENMLEGQRSAVRTLVGLIKTYMGFYRDIKLTSGKPDFSDCELMLLEKLRTDESFRRQLSDRFTCMIVDEFQDSNDVQAEIFRLISNGKNNLFYVGDVKQAIYMFRGGNPQIMAELCRVPRQFGYLREGLKIARSASEKRSFGFAARGADIAGFCKRHRRFYVMPLNRNFRSRRTVIDFVNAVFSGLMTERYGSVDYSGGGRLEFGAGMLYPEIPEDKKPLYKAEINLIDYPDLKKIDGDTEERADYDQALFVAERIKKLVDEGFLVTVNNETRPCRYSDIAVLLRGNGRMSGYKDTLEKFGIPAITPSGKEFLESEEIGLIMNFLRVIDNPLSDEELLKVLMCPIYEMSAEELAQIRLGTLGLPEELPRECTDKISARLRGSSLYGCLNACLRPLAEVGEREESEDEPDALYEAARAQEAQLSAKGIKREINPKAAKFMSDLNALRMHMSGSSIESLVRRVYDLTELYGVISTYEGGRQRVSNIRLMQKYAADFEENDGGTLSDFIRFINSSRAHKSGFEAGAVPEDAGNAVRIMTFHGSKGLEMPICIIAELDRKASDKDASGKVLISHTHGLAMEYVDRRVRVKLKPFAYNALHEVIYDGIFGEELRLLYVAMTRAQEKLILVGKKSALKNASEMREGAPETAFTNLSPLSWILSSLMRYCRIGGDGETVRIGGLNAEIITHTVPPEITEISETGSAAPDPDITAEIEKNLRAEYSHAEETSRRAKYSVTELAHLAQSSDTEEVVYLNPPSFIRGESAFSGKEVGDAYHHLMQYYPLERITPDTDLRKLTESAVFVLSMQGRLTDRELKILTSEKLKCIDKTVRFLESPLGQRMLKSRRVERETPFYAELPARMLGLDHDGEVSLQGRTDLFFYEDDGIVLVDYKSDSAESMEKEKESYSKQLLTYKNILPKITGTRVKQMYLYAFSTGEEIDIERYLSQTGAGKALSE